MLVGAGELEEEEEEEEEGFSWVRHALLGIRYESTKAKKSSLAGSP